MLLPYFRDTDTTSLNLTSRFNTKVNLSDTLNMLAPYLRKADTTSMLLPYFRDTDTTSLNLTSRFNTKVNLSDTLNMLAPYLRKADTTSMLLPYFRDTDTTSLNLTSRFNTKVNLSDTLNMLAPYLRKADTTSMLLPYFRDADTSLLNLTSRFAAKQNTLNGTGFIKASGTNITYDNSSYLRTGLADSTYLPLTGGTLTGALNVSAAGVPLTVNSTNSNTYKFNLSSSGVVNSYFGSNNVRLFSIADKNVNELFFIDTLGKVSVNATGVPININSINNNFYKLSFSNINSGAITSYLGSDASKSLSIANNLANEVAYITYLGDAAFNGNITEGGNNVLTSADTTTMLAPYIESGDTATMLNPYWRSGKFSGTLPIANGGTNSSSASNARSNLNVDYVFLPITNGTLIQVNTNRVFIVNTGGSLTTQIDLTTDLTAGRTFMVKNLASGTIVSTASNVIPLNGASAGTAILGAGNATPQWCTLVCDGTNWHIIQIN
jgi:hypothetical protein